MDARGEPLDLGGMRRPYTLGTLDESHVDPDPLVQLQRWLDDAVAAGLPEPNAMVLATADAQGCPSGRLVLLKGLDARGCVFFTGLGSRKARELAANPRVCLVFPWFAMERQVVLTGTGERVPRAESLAYWASRPREHQLAAWASSQSQVVASRAWLEQRLAEAAAHFPEGTPVPLPDDWGGFRVQPQTVELWQGGGGRLHDRLRYRREGPDWALERLGP